MVIKIITIFIIYCLLAIKCNEFKLSDSKVLIPRTSFLSINYTIKGSNTVCHEWFSGTPEVIVVTPIFDQDSLLKCSHETTITSVWQSNHRATATVYAKNIATGHVVKCDIIVDNIHRLSIETRTLELYLHETPEALIAKAYDEYGNTFSTLDGIPFEWSIHATGVNVDGQNVIRFITWTESEYITPTLIGALEQQGLQGYMQLVSGLKTGAAKISLVFRDDKLKTTVQSPEIKMLVMANAALSPSLAYVIPHTQLSYKVLVHSQGSTQEIKMPNNQYYLNINNTDLAELDENGSTVTAKKFGQTEVTLIDKNIIEDFRHPSSVLYIVEQGFLTFHISPGDNQWVLQSGHDNIYVITVRPFDFNSHPIYMSDNLRLETEIPTEYFEMLFSSSNGTYNVVRAIKEGHTVLRSNFSFILLQNGTKLKLESPVVGSQKLVIYLPIVVIPSYIVIPWYSNGVAAPGYLFKATGGSGEYKWLVSNSRLLITDDKKSSNCSVSVNSLGYIKPLKLGVSFIVAADQRNLINRGVSTVNVDIIRSINFLLDKVEVEVDKQLNLSLQAINSKNEIMSHCHWLPFELSSVDASKIEIIEVISSHESNVSGACALITVRGRSPGFSKVTISLVKLLTTRSTKEFLTTSITIGSFKPTRFTDQSNEFSTIGVLSIKQFRIVDGLLPWTLDPSKFYYEFNENDQTKHMIKKIALHEADLNSKFTGLVLQIQCVEVGEVDISVSIGNKPSIKNPYPTVSTGHVKLSCALPVFMKLIPRLVLTNISLDCPYENDTEAGKRITVNNKKPLIIEVSFTDRNGYQLERSESFSINIEITSLSTTQNVNNIVEDARPKVVYTAGDNNSDSSFIRSYFYVTPYGPGLHAGDIHIKAVSNSYRLGKGPTFHLESYVNVRISQSMVVEPMKLVMYQHMKVSGKLTVRFGSGHFIVLPPSPDFLKVNLLHKSLDNNEGDVYEVTQMKVDNSQRNGVIQIIDTCFNSIESESENSKTVSVHLVRPHKLTLLSINKIQLGSQIYVLLQVFDDTGREFPAEYLSMLYFDLVINDNSHIISAHSFQSKEWITAPCEHSKMSGLLFQITGEKVGFTSLSVTLRQNNDIVSNIQKIEVFPALKLTPKHTVLLEGTEVQLTSTGGPHCCQEMIHFSIVRNVSLASKEAKIEFIKGPNGLIRGVTHGAFAVTVRIELSESDPLNGNQLTVLSKDEGLVGVVQIRSMSIQSPTNRLIAGNSMPIWITFSSSGNDLEHLPITGFSLAGQQKDQLSFKWHLNPPQGVLTNLGNFLEPTGINIGSKYLHSGMRISSLNPGTQKIEVSVSGLSPNWLSRELNKFEPLISRLNVAIISRLEIIEPAVTVRTLLLPPSSRINLKSSLDNEAVVSYSLSHYTDGKSAIHSLSKIHPGNILETSDHITGTDEEQFVLHVRSSQPLKLNAANEVVGNQSLALFVTVKHPTYSMINPYIYRDSIFEKFQASKNSDYNSDIAFLPLGGPFVFRITNHDELGNVFDVSSDSNTLSYHLHRSDNLAISTASDEQSKLSSADEKSKAGDKKLSKLINSDALSSQRLLQLQGLLTGENILQLFYRDSLSESRFLTDIVAIPTGSALQCRHCHQHTNIEGLKLRYLAPFDNGYWSSSDPDTVSIDSATGVALLKKQGTSNIVYGLTDIKNVKGQLKKNVLISQEISVLPASRLSLKIVDGFIPASNDSCSKTQCIPINLHYQSHALLAAIYIDTSSMKYQQIENYPKFDKEYIGNIPNQSPDEAPIECNIDFKMDGSEVFRHDLLSSLLDVQLRPIHSLYDPSLGVRQWACYLTAKPIGSLANNELVSLLLSLTSALQVQITARLQNSDVKSTSLSVSIVTGYVLLMTNETRTSLFVKSSGEVLTDIQLVLAPATKHLLEENKNFVFSVVSNKPHVLEVLAPRESSTQPGLWIYPLKAAVVNKDTIDKVDITISFPLTKQQDKITVSINIVGKHADSTLSTNLDGGLSMLSSVNWVKPVVCVLVTGVIAVVIVMLVNNFIRPTVDNDLISSPAKDINQMSFAGNLPYRPSSPVKYTQHVWGDMSSPTMPDYYKRNTPYGARM